MSENTERPKINKLKVRVLHPFVYYMGDRKERGEVFEYECPEDCPLPSSLELASEKPLGAVPIDPATGKPVVVEAKHGEKAHDAPKKF